MALIAAAMCPHPMTLIPEVAGKTAEWEWLRAACTEAIRQLRVPFWYLVGKAVPSADAPQLIVIIGGDEATRSFDPAAAYPIWSGGHVLRHQAASQSYRASDVWRAACASLRI